ncbi:unnamed protein product [Ranitomeya imitator]|uniref:FHA domain-containing protein n=1 Tax=Ranitomeya imitator TaxID=111125 RepID=A0ABN9L1L5_9NEOB|nr:unnamed protein product [Ranitomeya imitator]
MPGNNQLHNPKPVINSAYEHQDPASAGSPAGSHRVENGVLSNAMRRSAATGSDVEDRTGRVMQPGNKEGRTYVGREDAESEQDIVLHGLDLESEHCIFENLNGRVTLIPLNGAQCSVNGIQILEAAPLNQGKM